MSRFINEILGEGGAFSKASSTYQHRVQQVDMAKAVESAIDKRKHALIEAGTGTGKTFAYLVPAIQYAVESGKKVVVSTKTKNLQSQLLNKDIPFLEEIIPFKFRVEKIIGIGNFICYHRLLKHLKLNDFEDIGLLRRIVSFYCEDKIRFKDFFNLADCKKSLIDEENEDEVDKNEKRIKAVLNENDDGEESRAVSCNGVRDEIEDEIDIKLWGSICAESDSCHRKKCGFYNECYYFKAKERQKIADIFIVNHALFFSDLAVRKATKFRLENAVIPKFDAVIFDEAHNIEDTAANFMGIKVSSFRLKHFLGSLAINTSKNEALKRAVGNKAFMKTIPKIIEKLQIESTSFFNELKGKYKAERAVRVKKPGFIDASGLVSALKDVASCLKGITGAIGRRVSTRDNEGADTTTEAGEMRDLETFLDRTTTLINDVETVVGLKNSDWAYWIEATDAKAVINASPVDIARELSGSLFGRMDTCVLTSATLAVNEQFDFIGGRLGLAINNAVQLIVGTPFNYLEQAVLCVPEDSMEPTIHNGDAFAQRVADQLKKIMKITKGRTFVLFTSYKLMDDTYNLVESIFDDWGYPIFKQSLNYSRDKLLEDFLNEENSILFGAESFWQGIDVPGDKLSCVVIPKLPFGNPGAPLVAARLDFIKRRGFNGFMAYTLPDATLRLKQGTGRLIRRETDRGAVVVLDRRMLTKPYAGVILRSLPNYYRTQNIDDIGIILNSGKEVFNVGT
jgi:ATP-dependent DNA helicase DinG